MDLIKRHIGSLIVGALVVGVVSYAGASALTTSDEGALLTQSEGEQAPDAEAAPRERPGRVGRRGMRHAIRGEAVVPDRDGEGFNNVKFDRGLLDRVDGTTLVINEEDGTTVEVPTSDDTKIGRDGQPATPGDLEAGDHINAVQVDEGDGFVTKHVRAVSADRFEEMQQKREECKENPAECRRERLGRMRERRQDRAG
ncbi:MAG: hypothetical protein WD646_03655 [Actinomycetota bacterium]